MTLYYANLRDLLSTLCAQPWGTASFWVTLVVSLLILFFSAGTLSRLIFSKDLGLLKPFLGMLVVTACGFAACGAWLTWGNDNIVIALGLGALGSLVGLVPVAFLMGMPFGPAFGLTVFSLAILGGVANLSGRVCDLVADAASKLETKVETQVEAPPAP